jgi:hypothetical protein
MAKAEVKPMGPSEGPIHRLLGPDVAYNTLLCIGSYTR